MLEVSILSLVIWCRPKSHDYHYMLYDYEGLNLANQKSRALGASWREATLYFFAIGLQIHVLEENDRMMLTYSHFHSYELTRYHNYHVLT